MNSSPRKGRASVILSTASALSGCSGYKPPTDTPTGLAQAAAKTRPALLYVSDGDKGDVFVYSYSSLKLVRTLSGLQSPTGLSVDPQNGNVWVTVAGPSVSQVVEFAHGGSKPMRTFQDGGDEGVEGCAVSPTSYDLAISNASFGGDDPGDVVIYNLQTGRSKTYRDKGMFYFALLGYDADGNLFADATPSSYNSTFRLDELPNGGNKLVNIRWHGPTIRDAENVQYDGTSVTVGDLEKALIYQTAGGKVLGTTTLTRACYVDQYFIDDDNVIVPSNCNKAGTISVYDYPEGGVPTKTIGGFGLAFGAVISR
jgi:WD40 repeat protein